MEKATLEKAPSKVLVIDIGGTNVKILATGEEFRRKFPSGKGLTPEQMVQGVKDLAADWIYDAVAIGYPGPVMNNRPVIEPGNLGPGWVDFDFETAFGHPVKMLNDAALQAYGSYEGGKMLFLGLGTGLGSCMIVEDLILPLELAHLPFRKSTFEDYVGVRGLEMLGKKVWTEVVHEVVGLLRAALLPDITVIGGGNVKKLKILPEGCKAGSNSNAFVGGFRLWQNDH